MGKAYVSVGYSKKDLASYRHTDFTKLTGADIRAEDDLGNVIQVNVRGEGQGYRISLNGTTLSSGYKYGNTIATGRK